MTKFYTGRGDKGESAFGKIQLPKTDYIFGAMGVLDELNAVLGFCRVEAVKKNREVGGFLKNVQEVIFIIQAETAAARFNFKFEKRVTGNQVAALGKKIAEIDRQIPEITKFVIPGGSELAARLEIARTTARKAERIIAKYKSKISPFALTYLNRLSSCLFALSRFVNHKSKIKEENPKY